MMIFKTVVCPALILLLALGRSFGNKENLEASLAEDESFWGRQLRFRGGSMTVPPSPTTAPIPKPTTPSTVAPVPTAPSITPFPAPSVAPVPSPTRAPVPAPTVAPVPAPTVAPVPTAPTVAPLPTAPNVAPFPAPTVAPVPAPTHAPVPAPTVAPVPAPTLPPTKTPTPAPTLPPTDIVYGLQPSCSTVDNANYDICLDLLSLSGRKETWMDAFGRAKQRWESIIVGNLPDHLSTTFPPQASNFACTGFPSIVDDLYICGEESIIDGPGLILGSATWILGQHSGDINPRTGMQYVTALTGYMEFDTADIRLLTEKEFELVVLHEMAHVLGIGSLWNLNGLYINGSGRYTSGTHADVEWKSIGCSGPLPVELEGGDGTKDGHWDEECLDSELMTEFLGLEPGPRPISRITIGSMEDMGYDVDYSQADDFNIGDLGVCGSSCPQAGTRRLRTGEDRVLLSSDDMEIIMRYAKPKLDKLHNVWEETEILQGNDDNGIEAGFVISVLYQDAAGQLHDVLVTWEAVKNLDY